MYLPDRASDAQASVPTPTAAFRKRTSSFPLHLTRLWASRRPTLADATDNASKYSHAVVVEPLHVAPCSDRLLDACSDALDLKPPRAVEALRLLAKVAHTTTGGERSVMRWALNAAAHRAQADALRQVAQAYRLPYPRQPEPRRPPEPLVRFVCAEMSHSTFSTDEPDPEANHGCVPLPMPLRPKLRTVQMSVSPAVALLAVVCALARTQSVIRRIRASDDERLSIRARASEATVFIDIVGEGPVAIVVRTRRFAFHPSAAGLELVQDIAEVLEDFAIVMAG